MGNTISNTVQYTVLQIDRSCCIKTSLTATSEATSWAIPPLAICCCCCICCTGGLYLVHSGRFPGLSRRLDVLGGSGSTPKHSLRSHRHPKPRVHRVSFSDSSDSSDISDLELPRHGSHPLAHSFRPEVDRHRPRPSTQVQQTSFIPLVPLRSGSSLDDGIVRSQPSRDSRPHEQFEDWLQQAHLLRPGRVSGSTNPFT
uniref:Fusion-associated small transmembrane protein n=1 Tax=Atlantic salmon reovirus Canada-2009 TaxID=607705 RepID=C0L0N0_9REOV|nr:fusion-associated small transmembrane protein [Atlantic salmon reovirus Canada-2009]